MAWRGAGGGRLSKGVNSTNLGGLPMAASGGQRNMCSLPVGMLDVDVVCELVLIGGAETTPEGSYPRPFGGLGALE
jgi:hypothetical protein